ncbi:MAG: hypothetical protein IPK13_13235 [Deltaproteobacteria bacterium]|nr:hypothetical protein [Deltaproteobacteria bacterium]
MTDDGRILEPFDATTPLGVALLALSPDREAPDFSIEALDRIVDSLDNLPEDPKVERTSIERVLGLITALGRQGFDEAADSLAFALSCSWRVVRYLGFESSDADVHESSPDERHKGNELDRRQALWRFSGAGPGPRPASVSGPAPRDTVKLASLLARRRPEPTLRPRSPSTAAKSATRDDSRLKR